MSKVIEQLRAEGCWTRASRDDETTEFHTQYILSNSHCAHPPVVIEGDNTLLLFCPACGGID